jgi:hypothetical protein
MVGNTIKFRENLDNSLVLSSESKDLDGSVENAEVEEESNDTDNPEPSS